ncbi:MAG: DUF4412 domain-containing protein [Vicingaceae bacterium]
MKPYPHRHNFFIGITCFYLTLFTFSCSESTFDNRLNKGVIEYSISYPSIAEDNYMLDLMPKKMETSFYKGNFRSDIVAGMGLFKTSIISEKESNKLVHSVKMLNKKYSSSLSLEEIRDLNPNFKDIQITPINDTKEIAGYTCKAANVEVDGDSTWHFKIYYTDEININKPNRHTPYESISGVLMQYEIISYNTHMLFTAKKVVPLKDSIDTKLGEDYEQVSPQRLKEEIEAIFAAVK